MAFRKCEICGLKSEHKKGIKRFFMARYPLDEVRCKQWVKMTGQEDLVYLPIEKLHQLKFVCGKHFKDSDFNKKKTQLKKTAVPSVKLTAEPLPDEILTEFPYHIFRQQQSSQDDNPSTSSTSNYPPVQNIEIDNRIEIPPVEHTIATSAHCGDNTASSSRSYYPAVENIEIDKRIEIVCTIASSEHYGGVNIERSDYVEISSNGCKKDYPQKCSPLKITPVKSFNLEEDALMDKFGIIEHNIPPVDNTVDVITSEYSVLTRDYPSTSSAADIVPRKTRKCVVDSTKSRHKDSRKRSRKNREEKNDILTPRKKKLMKRIEKYKSTIKIIKQKAKLFDNIESKALKSMLMSALKNQNRPSQGKRWSDRDKSFAIAMYKKSPKLFRYMRHFIPLPSPRTIQNVLSKMPIDTGINKSIIEHLKRKALGLSAKNKTCVLLFDEMSLKKRLIYNSVSDKVEGYQDLGEHGRSVDLADKALVLLVQGVHEKFKQPIAHYFVKGTISSEKLVAIIKNAIKIVTRIGYKVIATVCDQGPTNVGALNMLKKFSGQALDSNFFLVDKIQIYIIFDVPHLFKSIRNNFFEGGELVFDGVKAKWSHLIEFQEKNIMTINYKKITWLHVKPKFRAKMKVALAAQVLGNRVYSFLNCFSDTFREEKEIDGTLKCDAIKRTASVIKELDILFDITNGPASPKDVKKGQRVNVTKNSCHHKLWPEFKNKIKSMHFLKSDSQLRLKNVRCINGYFMTICSLQDIWAYVHSIGFRFLNLRQLNQDSLENLFGLIRQHCPTNQNPTCHHFTAALKSSIITKLSTPIRGANCMTDDNKLVLDFQELLFPNSSAEELIEYEHSYPAPNDKDTTFYDDNCPVLHLPDAESTLEQELFENFEKQPVVYVSGYLASVLIKKTNCHKCCDSIRTTEPGNNKIYNYIALREWWPDKQSLTYPTVNLCNMVNTCVTVFERDVKPILYQNDVLKFSRIMMTKEISTAWMCEEHNSVFMDDLLSRLSLLLIRNECKKINISISDGEQLNADMNKIFQLKGSAK